EYADSQSPLGATLQGERRMPTCTTPRWMTGLLIAMAWLAGPLAHADVVTDWSTTAGAIAAASHLPAGGAYRVVAVVQTAVYEAVNAITQRYPSARAPLQAAPGAAVEAAVAAANRATLSALVPGQQATIDQAYQAAVALLPEGPATTAGMAGGGQAATAIPPGGAARGLGQAGRH